MSAPLPNPELEWAPVKREVEMFDPREVEARVGPQAGDIVRFSGGLANTNLRLPDGRVLRIYRRDPAARPKELALLRRGWTSFRVPQVLEVGDDFLVLEYVDHVRLPGDAGWGERVGAALAELHAAERYAQPGFLGSDLTVVEPWSDLVAAFQDHARKRLAAAPALAGLGDRVDAFLAARADAMRAEASEAVLLHGDFKASNLHAAGERLLVLDWEFAYAGPRLLDVGQLLRWDPPAAFVDGFAAAYGALPSDWRATAGAFDLVNLCGLGADVPAGGKRGRDVRARIERTLAT